MATRLARPGRTDHNGFPLYKYFKADMRSPYGTTLRWSLPRAGKPGAWKVCDAPSVLCRSGFHAFYHPSYLGGDTLRQWQHDKYRLFAVEVRGIGDTDSSKLVAKEMRLVREVKLSSREAKHVLEGARLPRHAYRPFQHPPTSVKDAGATLTRVTAERDTARAALTTIREHVRSIKNMLHAIEAKIPNG